MTAGIEIINDSGTVIISETFRNFHLIEKGSFVIPAGSAYTFTRSGRTYPLIAFRTSSLVGSTTQFIISGTVTRYFQAPMGSGDVTVEFWMFDVLTTPPADFGLEVYNSAGQLTYASGVAPLRIVGEVAMSAYTTVSEAYGSGRTYAAIQTFTGRAQDNTETVPDFWVTKNLIGMCSWSGVTITCKRNFTDTKTGEFDEDIPGFTWEEQAPRWLIVDVTHL